MRRRRWRRSRHFSRSSTSTSHSYAQPQNPLTTIIDHEINCRCFSQETDRIAMRPSISIITLLAALTTTSAFQTPSSPLHLTRVSQTVLTAEAKKRRRRKQVVDSDATTTPPPAPSPPKESAQSLAAQMLAQEKMMYDQEDDLTTFTPVPLSTSAINAAATKAGFDLDPPKEELNDLFDAGEFLSKKRERQLAELENAEGNPAVPTKKKIKRSDIQAYTKLLEMDPLADEDSRYFEDENEVDIISALLGDVEPGVGVETDEENRTGKKVVKKTSFLGIGSGPLQVGHFIGALGVVLMAFVEYPGFPLTNLPDPLRGALQGGEFVVPLSFSRFCSLLVICTS